MIYDIKDIVVQRVLSCFRATNRKGETKHSRTMEEILERFGQIFPRSTFEKVFSFRARRKRVREVEEGITFLIQDECLKSEVFWFTDRALDVPIVKYSLTQKGLQEILKNSAKKK